MIIKLYRITEFLNISKPEAVSKMKKKLIEVKKSDNINFFSYLTLIIMINNKPEIQVKQDININKKSAKINLKNIMEIKRKVTKTS